VKQTVSVYRRFSIFIIENSFLASFKKKHLLPWQGNSLRFYAQKILSALDTKEYFYPREILFSIFIGILSLLLILLLSQVVTAQTYQLNSWTPIISSQEQTVKKLEILGEKYKYYYKRRLNYCRKYYLGARLDMEEKIGKLSYDKTIVDKQTGASKVVRVVVKYDSNFVAVYLRPTLKLLNLNALPTDTSAYRFVSYRNQNDSLGWLIFINGAKAILQFFPTAKLLPTKKETNKNMEGRLNVYPLSEVLDFERLKIKAEANHLLYAQNKMAGYILYPGQHFALTIDNNQLPTLEEISWQAKKFLVLRQTAGPNRYLWQKDSLHLIDCGELIGQINLADSAWHEPNHLVTADCAPCFVNQSKLIVLWPNCDSLSYNLAPFQASKLGWQGRGMIYGQTKVVELYNLTQVRAWWWLNANLITAVPDSSTPATNNQRFVYINDRLLLLDTVGKLQPIMILKSISANIIKPITLRQLAIKADSRFTCEAYVGLDENLLELSYDRSGKKGLYWLSRDITTEYFGELLYSGDDSIMAFKDGNRIIVPSKDLQGPMMNYLIKDEGDQNFYSFTVKHFDQQTVFEVDFNDGVALDKNWIWPAQAQVTNCLGIFAGHAEYDSAVIIFLNWEKMTLFDSHKNIFSLYGLPDVCQMPDIDDLHNFVLTLYLQPRDNLLDTALRCVYGRKNFYNKWLLDESYVLVNN
jgi:hypothetical protein